MVVPVILLQLLIQDMLVCPFCGISGQTIYRIINALNGDYKHNTLEWSLSTYMYFKAIVQISPTANSLTTGPGRHCVHT